MRVNPDDRIAGLPAPTARELMRFFDHQPLPEHLMADYLDGGNPSEVAQELAAGGYLEFVRTDEDGEAWWRPTTKGGALAQASFRPPVTRATAERLLKGVIDRARRINSTPGRVVEVAELIVFGSYLDPTTDRLGDLDLAVKFRNLPADASHDEFVENRLAYARASGRRFSSLFTEMAWPETEAMQALRKRSPTIKITVEDITTLTDRWEVVFRAADPDGTD